MPVPAGRPSWAINAGLEGHTSGPDLEFVSPVERTAARVIVHQGDDGMAAYESAYSLSHDDKKLLRATRRMAKPAARRFARRLALPEDECAIVQERKEAGQDRGDRDHRGAGQLGLVLQWTCITNTAEIRPYENPRALQGRTVFNRYLGNG